MRILKIFNRVALSMAAVLSVQVAYDLHHIKQQILGEKQIDIARAVLSGNFQACIAQGRHKGLNRPDITGLSIKQLMEGGAIFSRIKPAMTPEMVKADYHNLVFVDTLEIDALTHKYERLGTAFNLDDGKLVKTIDSKKIDEFSRRIHRGNVRLAESCLRVPLI